MMEGLTQRRGHRFTYAKHKKAYAEEGQRARVIYETHSRTENSIFIADADYSGQRRARPKSSTTPLNLVFFFFFFKALHSSGRQRLLQIRNLTNRQKGRGPEPKEEAIDMAKKNRGGQQQNSKVPESMRNRIAQLLSRFNSADDEGEVFE